MPNAATLTVNGSSVIQVAATMPARPCCAVLLTPVAPVPVATITPLWPSKPAVNNDTIQADYSRQAATYDQRWADYVAGSLSLTLAQCDLQAAQTLLDVGCGTGTLLHTALQQTPGLHVVGVDLTPAMLAIARQKLPNTATLQQASADCLPFADHRFDWVVSSSVFHYLRNPRTALAELRRVLKPEGYLVLTDWDRSAVPMAMLDCWLSWRDPAHYCTYTTHEAQTLVIEAGFTVKRCQQASLSWFWQLFTIKAGNS